MKAVAAMRMKVALACGMLCGCGGSGGSTITPPTVPAAPAITSTDGNGVQNGATIVTLTANSTIHYTTDGTTPTAASPQYQAPFLVAANQTVKAIAASGTASSTVTSKSFAPNIPSGTLVWSDEFTNTTASNTAPNPAIWTYDTSNNGFGNHELETYCAWGANIQPCSTASPSAYTAPDGYLHIVAQQTSPGVYTSARLKSEKLFSLQYGRIEFRAQVPEAQGFWPAAWLLGNNIATDNWPACGEIDVLERVNAAKTPDWNEGSIHGIGFTGDNGIGTVFNLPVGQTAAGWHTYGILWAPGSVAFYVDDPSHPYVTYTNPASLKTLPGAVWPFDAGQASFLLLNLAIGGDWPGNPNASTSFPAQMLVDYVRVYTN